VEPTIGNLILEMVSLDYSHTIMAAAGHQAEAALQQAMKQNAGKYLLIVTGSVPLADGGVYTTIGGRTAKAVLEEAAQGAAAIVAVGACAHGGSVQAARPNPTGAVGVSEVIKDKPVINHDLESLLDGSVLVHSMDRLGHHRADSGVSGIQAVGHAPEHDVPVGPDADGLQGVGPVEHDQSPDIIGRHSRGRGKNALLGRHARHHPGAERSDVHGCLLVQIPADPSYAPRLNRR
jgi:hypothetical protein